MTCLENLERRVCRLRGGGDDSNFDAGSSNIDAGSSKVGV